MIVKMNKLIINRITSESLLLIKDISELNIDITKVFFRNVDISIKSNFPQSSNGQGLYFQLPLGIQIHQFRRKEMKYRGKHFDNQ